MSDVEAARLDQAGLYMKGLPHWEPMPYAGRDVAHRRWQWVDDNGIMHIVGCGSGKHGENAQREDFRQIRQRVRACEGGACQHALVRAAAANAKCPHCDQALRQNGDGDWVCPGCGSSRVDRNGTPEFCPNCAADDEYQGGICYSCGYGSADCPRCGFEIGDNNGFCPSCHYEVGHDSQPAPATPWTIEPEQATQMVKGLPPNQGNILDPVQDQLDPAVFIDSSSPEPIVKPEIRKWIYDTIYKALTDAGYDGMEEWMSLVLTGSLTTYQYSEHSDCDISLFVDTPKLPEWSRAEMIGVMVENCDGQLVPGTTHPLQVFVVDTKKLSREDLYQPGLRSGYELATQRWIVPPDPSRVQDVQAEQYGDYFYALEVADKLDRLLTFEPEKAKLYYQAIHRRRQQDQQRGRGDASQSNICYKMLDQRGLFDRLRAIGVKIA